MGQKCTRNPHPICHSVFLTLLFSPHTLPYLHSTMSDAVEVKIELPAESDTEPAAVTAGTKGRKRGKTISTVKREPSDKTPNPKSKPGRKRKSTEDEDDNETQTSNKRVGGKKWSGTELVALLDAAIKGGGAAAGFDGTVPGRTKQQCNTTWR